VSDVTRSLNRTTINLPIWVGKALRELKESVPEEWRWVLDEIKNLLAELPPEGSRRLFELWKQIPEPFKLQTLLVLLVDTKTI
jgi:hypothetical protein